MKIFCRHKPQLKILFFENGNLISVALEFETIVSGLHPSYGDFVIFSCSSYFLWAIFSFSIHHLQVSGINFLEWPAFIVSNNEDRLDAHFCFALQLYQNFRLLIDCSFQKPVVTFGLLNFCIFSLEKFVGFRPYVKQVLSMNLALAILLPCQSKVSNFSLRCLFMWWACAVHSCSN